MAIKSAHWFCSFVNICLYICLLAEFTYSNDVPYSLNDISLPSSDLEIFLDGHGIYKRAVNNDTSADNSTVGTATSTAASAPTTTTTPAPTTAAPTTKPPTTPPQTDAPTGGSTPFPINEVKSGNHKYYRSEIYTYAQDNVFYKEVENMKSHTTLDNNHRVAITVNLNFPFRFYGHEIKNFTIATGGFLYMSPFLHRFLTATQYIAPLMANFDTRLGVDSRIYYKELTNRYVVEWQNLYLQDQNHTNPFSFQTTLHSNGSIVFAYKSVPIPVSKISTNNHPVKVGLSDAFYIDKKQGVVTRRTIYEYHRVQVNLSMISQNVAVLLHPEQTCNLASDCHTCVTQDDSFDCKWCAGVGRCSDGLDWYRQQWRNSRCDDTAHNSEEICNATTTSTTTSTTTVATTTPVASALSTVICADGKATKDKSCPPPESKLPIAGIIVIIVILLALIGGLGGWVFYAYTHPQSASGMWLMEHRPSQMKSKLATMKFWKKETASGEKYRIESEA